MLDSPDGAKRLEFVSQTGRTILILRELLLRGEFPVGVRLSEVSLVARLGVSRTPIRNALDRLAHEGLVEASASGGYNVRAFTTSDIWDSLDMRASLEGIAARLAAERLQDPAELQRMRHLQSQMDDIVQANIDAFAQYVKLNETFHFELVRLSKSPMLERSLDHLNTLPFAGPSKLVFARMAVGRGAELLIQGHGQHHEILEAIANKNGADAESLVHEHIRLARINLGAALQNAEIWRDIPGVQLIQRDSA